MPAAGGKAGPRHTREGMCEASRLVQVHDRGRGSLPPTSLLRLRACLHVLGIDWRKIANGYALGNMMIISEK